MHRELISYLPPKLRDKVIYKEVCNAEENEFKLLFSNIDYMANDIFISDLTLEGVKRWEKDLKINHFDTDTLEDRRFRILNRFLNKLPYTMRTLENTLDTLVGKGGYQLNFNNETYTLSISINLTVKSQLEEVKRTLYYMVPANIVQDIQLLYNSHKTLSQYTHQQLSVYTHKQLREDMLYKYVFYQGSMITALNCLEGQVKGIELLGNTIQNPENLSDIKSSGILQSDGKYKYTLNVCGKNMFDKNKKPYYIFSSTNYTVLENGLKVENVKEVPYSFITYNLRLKPNTTYSLTWCNTRIKGNMSKLRVRSINSNVICVDNSNTGNNTRSFTTDSKGLVEMNFYSCFDIVGIGEADFTNIQLEESPVATEYEPYKENKVDILLPCQLEKIGDLEDRLYFDEKEMAWCVDKNNIKISNYNDFNIGLDLGSLINTYRFYIDINSNLSGKAISSKLKYIENYSLDEEHFCIFSVKTNRVWIFIDKAKIDSLEGSDIKAKLKTWLNNNLVIYVTLETPQKIILPQSTQILLNSFTGTNHMWLDSGEVTGTFKAGIKTK